jgi:UrcA family protein
MGKLISVMTAVATIAMAAVPLSAVVSVAHAAEVRIPVADLDLSNPADAARFQERVDHAAKRLCHDGGQPLSYQSVCRAAVRRDAVAGLGDSQREGLKLAVQGKAVQGSWRQAGF